MKTLNSDVFNMLCFKENNKYDLSILGTTINRASVHISFKSGEL